MPKSSDIYAKRMLIRNRRREKFKQQVIFIVLVMWIGVQAIQLHTRGKWMIAVESRLEKIEGKDQ